MIIEVPKIVLCAYAYNNIDNNKEDRITHNRDLVLSQPQLPRLLRAEGTAGCATAAPPEALVADAGETGRFSVPDTVRLLAVPVHFLCLALYTDQTRLRQLLSTEECLSFIYLIAQSTSQGYFYPM